MTALFLLELRKHRLVFAGFAAALALTPPAAALGAWTIGAPVPNALEAACFFWTFIVLPLAAVTAGAASGTELRAGAAAEELLPVSPGLRAAAAALAAGLHVALLAALVLAWRILSAETGAEEFFATMLKILLFGLPYLLAAGFVFALVIGHGVAGGILGAVLGFTAVCTVGWGLLMQGIFPARAPFTAQAFCIGAVCLAGASWAVFRAAGWTQREQRGWAGAAGSAAALCGGAVLAVLLALACWRALTGTRYFIKSYHLSSWEEALPEAAREQAYGGVLMGSLKGDLVRVLPDGRVQTLLPGESRPLKDVLGVPQWRRVGSCVWDGSGRLWAIVDPGTRPPEIWRAEPGLALSLYQRAPGGARLWDLMRCGESVCARAWIGNYSDGGTGYAVVPEPGKPWKWDAKSGVDAFVSRLRYEQGRAARFMKSERTLVFKPKKGPMMRWRLPEAVSGPLYADYAPLMPTSRGGMFALPVRLKSGERAAAVCRLDGSVSLAWKGGEDFAFYRLLPMADGSYRGWSNRSTLLIITREGEVLPPLDLRPVFERLSERGILMQGLRGVLHAGPDSLWLLHDSAGLLRVDARTGRMTEAWRFPNLSLMLERESPVAVGREGVFVHTGSQLWHAAWDGGRRRLQVR